MLESLAVQGLQIVLHLALEGPSKYRQHRLIALVFDDLSVTIASFEELSVTPLLHVTPNCDLG